jgi:DHA2 family multidrug resistance protein
VMIVGGILTFWRAFTRDEPLVDFSAFANTNFAVGSVFSFVMGIGLYGMTYLYPLYLSAIRGYDSLMIGQTVFVSGLAMFVSAPLAGMLSSKMDLRLMLLCGFVGFGTSSWMLTGMTADWDFNELFWPQVLRGLSLMICMVPINNLALGTLPPSKMKSASGLYNLMRNLGGAVGLAMINTVLTNRRALHTARLDEAVNWANPEALSQFQMMRQNLASHGLPPDGALVQMVGKLARQATIMSFIDVFTLLTMLFVGLALMALAMKPPARAAAGGGGH